MTTKLTREDVQLLFANNKKQDTLKTLREQSVSYESGQRKAGGLHYQNSRGLHLRLYKSNLFPQREEPF